jgi:hypothetical protein
MALAVGGRLQWPSFSVASAFAVLIGLGLGACARHARAPEKVAAAAFTVLGWIPVLAGGALAALDDDIVASAHVRCGLGSLGLVIVAPVLVAVCLTISGAVSAAAGRKLLAPAVRHLATALTVMGVVFVAFTTVTRHACPTPDGYLAAVPVVDRLDVGSSGVATYSGSAWRVELRRESPGTCVLELWFQGEERSGYGPGEVGDCPPVLVLRDDRADLLVVARDASRPLVALTAADPWPVDLKPRSIAARLRPPVEWVIGAVVSLSLAVVFLFTSRRMRQRAARLDGVEATHRGDGWIDLGEGSPVHVPLAAKLDVGEVVLDVAPPVHPGVPVATYRTVGVPDVRGVVPGSLAYQRGQIAGRAASFDACALATVVLAFVPLLVAHFLGL